MNKLDGYGLPHGRGSRSCVIAMKRLASIFFCAALLAGSAAAQSPGNIDPALDAFVKSFQSRGQMADGTKPLTTRDSCVLAGFVTETAPQFVTLKDAVGTITRVAREDIQTLAASPVSMMPEGTSIC